jgi:hypothetical protein
MVKKYKNCGNNILFVIMGLLITSFCIMFIIYLIYLINVISKNKDIYIEEEEETCNQCKGK